MTRSDLASKIAIDAVKTVCIEEGGHKEIDIKRYAKVEKVPGGAIEDSCVLRGVMLNKDVTHPRMKRRIEKPRIVLLDCNLEYKKGRARRIEKPRIVLLDCNLEYKKGESQFCRHGPLCRSLPKHILAEQLFNLRKPTLLWSTEAFA
ncbi:hypothetical protein HPB51_002793 [Rhipicephalus microplus]|uniref:Uncharacterized protein n=1 Tax=Rhipicephalus microplus TaxID=6941 RepID=A0A9J6EWL4_RHIMP|nr:hypothetical protein HPB51_002793 [Rhipicephalus microplus]